jgi:hypothetical protein
MAAFTVTSGARRKHDERSEDYSRAKKANPERAAIMPNSSCERSAYSHYSLPST